MAVKGEFILLLALISLLVLMAGCTGGGSPHPEAAHEEAPQAEDDVSGQGAGPETITPASALEEAPPAFDPGRPIIIERGNPDRKAVTLTIDDGWNKDDRILDLLESYGIRCTVFPIGGRGVAEANPAWIERMDRMGFEVCTHTYSHYKLTDHPEEWIREDIRKGREVIAAVTSKYYPYMRPPGGFVNEAVKRAAAANGCYVVLWSNALGDTNPGATVEGEVSAVLSRLSNGDIILCHFGGYHTYEALSRLIPEMMNRGYRFVTLSELLAP